MRRLAILGCLALFFIVSLCVTVEAQDKSLVLWLSFHGAQKDVVEDLSGNGNNGKIVGAKRVDGKFGQGMSFGKKGEYVEVPNVLQPEGTIEMWFKPNWGGGDAGSFRLFDANTAAIYYMIGKGKTIGDRENTFGFYLEDAADADFQDWQTPAADIIKAGEWHHVAAAWKFPGSAQLYMNGEKVGEVAGLGNFPPLALMLRIGASGDTGYMPAANGADSVIDEAAIYTKALSKQEMKGT